MYYPTLVKGKFIKRLNRFVARCDIQGQKVKVHVPNTSRLTELQKQGALVYVKPTNDPQRKTNYTLIHIEKQGVLINIDSQSPNHIIYDSLKEQPHLIGIEEDFILLKKEVSFDQSRFDLYYETLSGQKGFIEVKGVTYEEDKIAYFPGAPTARGVKHLEQLTKARQQGYQSHMVYCIQVPYVKQLKLYETMDPLYYKTYFKAKKAGVTMHAFVCDVSVNEVALAKQIPCP